jgi:hypothetical protein
MLTKPKPLKLRDVDVRKHHAGWAYRAHCHLEHKNRGQRSFRIPLVG